MLKHSFLSLLALVLMNPFVFAKEQKADMDPVVMMALQATVGMLNNPVEREQEASKTAEGRAASADMRRLAGDPQNLQAMYELAAQIFSNLVMETGGDAEAMQKILDEALKDPSAFAEKFTDSQKASLKRIAERSPLTQSN